jgi:hypothetical protein
VGIENFKFKQRAGGGRGGGAARRGARSLLLQLTSVNRARGRARARFCSYN